MLVGTAAPNSILQKDKFLNYKSFMIIVNPDI